MITPWKSLPIWRRLARAMAWSLHFKSRNSRNVCDIFQSYILPNTFDSKAGYTTASAWARAFRGKRCYMIIRSSTVAVWYIEKGLSFNTNEELQYHHFAVSGVLQVFFRWRNFAKLPQWGWSRARPWNDNSFSISCRSLRHSSTLNTCIPWRNTSMVRILSRSNLTIGKGKRRWLEQRERASLRSKCCARHGWLDRDTAHFSELVWPRMSHRSIQALYAVHLSKEFKLVPPRLPPHFSCTLWYMASHDLFPPVSSFVPPSLPYHKRSRRVLSSLFKVVHLPRPVKASKNPESSVDGKRLPAPGISMEL